MATVWSVPKQEYNNVISNMDQRCDGEIASNEYIYKPLILFSKMVWTFQRRLSRQFYNRDYEAEFQAELYKNIDPDTSKAIIAVTRHPYHAVHKIITSVNFLPIHFWEGMILISISWRLRVPAED